jgi:serine/threonine-protein kinase
MSDAAPQRARDAVVQDLTGTTVGRFFIRRLLGQGGMGQVYEAEDTRLKRPVALKRMAPQLRADEHYRRRFLKEAECASRLTHQHIAGIYDVFEQEGEVFLVMEFVAGETMRQRMQRPFALDEILDVFTQCATALVAAQEQGIVHRDIKPENIMLTPSLQAKILDFGVARVQPKAGDATTQSVLSTAGGMAGTLAYMPPEALLEKSVDGRSDVFALGVTLYEAVTGQHPFLADTFLNTMERILHHAPPAVNLVNHKAPAELARIVNKMLSKTPPDRYATSADLLVDLRALHRTVTFPTFTSPSPAPTEAASIPTAPLPAAAPPQPAAQAAAPQRGMSTVAKALIGVAAAGLLAAGLYLFWAGRTAVPVPPAQPVAAQPATEGAPGIGASPEAAPSATVTPETSAASDPPATATAQPAAPPAAPPSAVAQPNSPAVPATARGGTPPPTAAEPRTPPRPTAPAAPAERPLASPGLGDVEVITDVLAAQAILTAPDGRTQECQTPCRFAGLRPGRYTMQLTKSGYRTLRRIIELRAGSVSPQNLKLEPQRASLEITSDPSQAEVYVNGERQASLTPATISLAPGTYRIALQKAGYGRYEGSVELKDEDIRGLNFQLQAQQGQPAQQQAARPQTPPAARAAGFVDLRTVPPGADILVDGASTGQRTPSRLELPAGQHNLTLFLRGYRSVQRTITVPENQTLPLQEVLVAQ